MMLPEFSMEFDKLGDSYGISTSSQGWIGRTKAYYECFKDLDREFFARMVEWAKRETDRFPPIKVLFAAKNACTPIGLGPEIIIKEDCNQCANSGYLTATRDDRYEFIFRCNCYIGKQMNGLIPIWNNQPRFKIEED